MVLQLALDPAQGHGYFVFGVVALQVHRRDEVQLAGADELQVEVGEPGNVPVFEQPPGMDPSMSGVTPWPTRNRRLRSISTTATTASRTPTIIELLPGRSWPIIQGRWRASLAPPP